MLSIGQFAKLAQVSARTVRHYETVGLLPAASRGENNYRFYNQKLLERMSRIRDLQALGFSLDDIKIVMSYSDSELQAHLQKRLSEIEREIIDLDERRRRVIDLLSISNKMQIGERLTDGEREMFMENIKNDVIDGMRSRYSEVSASAITYLKRDTWLDGHPQVGEFIEAFRKCVNFAKNKNLALGTARGSSPASMAYFALGFSSVDPLKYEMIPERLSAQKPFFHIDVEYERGQEFVDFCREVNRTLSYGEIQAYKMPLIDVIQSTHRKIGKTLDYEAIDDNSDIVLNVFKNQDLEKIFQFDFSPDSLVMSFEKFLPEYLGLDKISKQFDGQKTFAFRDIINITALWRPYTTEMIKRIEQYRIAKLKPFSYGFLSENVEQWLRPNYGVIIYHEDIIKIVSEYTGWDFSRSNILRGLVSSSISRELLEQDANWIDFQALAPKPVVELILEETKWSFCMPHAIAFAKFTKQTAVLKTLHRVSYFEAIGEFEKKHGITWDDIGIRFKGVSLHQG